MTRVSCHDLLVAALRVRHGVGQHHVQHDAQCPYVIGFRVVRYTLRTNDPFDEHVMERRSRGENMTTMTVAILNIARAKNKNINIKSRAFIYSLMLLFF